MNSKKLERSSRIIYYSISGILCLFLILLSSKIIDDLDNAVEYPDASQFADQLKTRELNARIDSQNVIIENLGRQESTLEKTMQTARENYENEKKSFDNWVETRKTLGSPDKDQEVTERVKKLDEYYAIEQDWRGQLNSIKEKKQLVSEYVSKLDIALDELNQEAGQKHARAYNAYELKVFLIRLLFTGPVLALGIFFFIRYRRHRFWPLFFGFTLFSIYAFFIGLLPYLPSYGGYVRSSVGIALSLGLGYYTIKKIRTYLEQKQAELKVSTAERAKNIQLQSAEKALENHCCPSCGKDFMIRKWEYPSQKNIESEAYRLVTPFCRHCGLQLLKSCTQCSHKNFALLPFCSNCGVAQQYGSNTL